MPPLISVISWVNKPTVYQENVMQGFADGAQIGYRGEVYDIERVVMETTGAERPNIGAAYNAGMDQAKGSVLAYMHQDLLLPDRGAVAKWLLLLGRQKYGAVGLLGSEIDTGGGYWHAPAHYQWGPPPEDTGHPGADREVVVLDGVLLVTRERLRWSEAYDKQHMVIEDYCMRIRALGGGRGRLWCANNGAYHVGGSGDLADSAYWDNMALFRQKWRGELRKWSRFPLPSIDRYRRYFEAYQAQLEAGVSEEFLAKGAWLSCWDGPVFDKLRTKHQKETINGKYRRFI